jgi:hypothetical protein
MDTLICPNSLVSTSSVTTAPAINPDAFAGVVSACWKAYDNAPSDKLMTLWRIMASTYNAAVLSTYPDGPAELKGKVSVLQPPTGSAKSLGAQVYAAMTARANLSRPEGSRLGILILVREIETAREMAAEINKAFYSIAPERGPTPDRAGQPCAIARHSKNAASVTLSELKAYDVVVVTHCAWLRALDYQRPEDSPWGETMEYMMEFGSNYDRRRLVICDESLSSAVEAFSVTLGNIEEVRAIADSW